MGIFFYIEGGEVVFCYDYPMDSHENRECLKHALLFDIDANKEGDGKICDTEAITTINETRAVLQEVIAEIDAALG